ncbi:hypothetical protein KM043_003205 [Ampulex compressa]|nr:hypothetical protein KM043_003205 [Ampulex compressa]
MFDDRSSDTVSFNSQVSILKSERTANCQTTEVVYTSNDAQTVETRTVETQTVNEHRKRTEVDYDKLADFLKRVTPGVLAVLDKAHESSAFNDYEPHSDQVASASTELLQRLSTITEGGSRAKVSDLSWSVAGGTLAVSHSVAYHENWCDHLSRIQLYKSTRDGSFTEASRKTLETDACVTTISYHPVEPSILAAGLFNGDVLVWNLREDDSVTPVSVYTHGDAVSQLSWLTRTLNDVSLLVSSSKDGYILIHKLVANFTTVRPYRRFKLAKEHNPAENTRPRSAGGRRERAVESGLWITSFDFSSKDSTIFIVGTLCGGVYKCSLDRGVPIEGDDTLQDPVLDEYERHEGSVTCVKCHPTSDLFITVGTDNEIRVYDIEQNSSQRSISVNNTTVGLAWMLGNRDVFAAYGAEPKINLYNVRDCKPVTKLKFEGSERENASCLRVNSKRDVLAVGDTRGTVEIWKVPRHL